MEDPQEPVTEEANKASSSPWLFETNWNFQQFELLNFLDGLRRTLIFVAFKRQQVHLVILFSSNFSQWLGFGSSHFLAAPDFKDVDTDWKIITGLVSCEGGTPLFKPCAWPFGSGTTRTLGDENDHHGY